MTDNDTERLANVFAEFHLGTAVVASFVLHILIKKGLVSGAEVAKAIRDATDQIPDEYAATPRLAGLTSLRPLLEDPELRHTVPFEWPPAEN